MQLGQPTAVHHVARRADQHAVLAAVEAHLADQPVPAPAATAPAPATPVGVQHQDA